ncbi:unnamed protein product [Linum trigynum]|uniref:Uncharacterized protein n=1 Tax=Linum trigynum TaxID=586398 RepID=A0AAV2D9E6_9ROSI
MRTPTASSTSSCLGLDITTSLGKGIIIDRNIDFSLDQGIDTKVPKNAKPSSADLMECAAGEVEAAKAAVPR